MCVQPLNVIVYSAIYVNNFLVNLAMISEFFYKIFYIK